MSAISKFQSYPSVLLAKRAAELTKPELRVNLVAIPIIFLSGVGLISQLPKNFRAARAWTYIYWGSMIGGITLSFAKYVLVSKKHRFKADLVAKTMCCLPVALQCKTTAKQVGACALSILRYAMMDFSRGLCRAWFEQGGEINLNRTYSKGSATFKLSVSEFILNIEMSRSPSLRT